MSLKKNDIIKGYKIRKYFSSYKNVWYVYAYKRHRELVYLGRNFKSLDKKKALSKIRKWEKSL